MRIAVLVVIVFASIAHANPAAEKLFQDGRTLLAKGKLDEACDAFRKSNELEARAGTLLNLADCEEKRGRVATAWVAFLDARALAQRIGDKDKTLAADRHAAAVQKKLPYLTIKTPTTKPTGFVVKRNGAEIKSGELDSELPIDPGTYEIEASAPGHVAWRGATTVVLGQKSLLEIPALEVDASVTTTTTTTTTPTNVVTPANGNGNSIVVPQPAPTDVQRRIGVGLAFGITSDVDLVFGARVPFQLAAVGNGMIRAVPNVFYLRVDDIQNDNSHDQTLLAFGVGVEYVAPLGPKFTFSAGLGVGIELFEDTYEGKFKNGYGALRLSPTLKVARTVDVGMHIQIVGSDRTCFDDMTGNPEGCVEVYGTAQLGVDYFFY